MKTSERPACDTKGCASVSDWRLEDLRQGGEFNLCSSCLIHASLGGLADALGEFNP